MTRGLPRTEDQWALALGALLLALGLLLAFSSGPDGMAERLEKAQSTLESEGARAPFHTIAWHDATDLLAGTSISAQGSLSVAKQWLGRPGSWKTNPLGGLIDARSQADRDRAKLESDLKQLDATAKRTAALAAQLRAGSFDDAAANAEAEAAVRQWRDAAKAAKAAKKRTGSKTRLPQLLLLGLSLMVLFGFAAASLGVRFSAFARGFGLVFGLGVLAYLFAAHPSAKQWGVGYAAWAIFFGLLVSNTVGTPRWARPAVQPELYIKTGLVLLGAEVLFGKVLAIGLPGLLVAWVVTPIVLVTTFWFGTHVLKIASKTLNITICADMSVCGVSAAIATAAACKAKKEELTLAVGLSLVFTSVMMIVLPAVIRALGMDEVLGGAWIGGTLDATGAVAAAGAFLGDRALHVAATIKMIQNVLIGVIAFGVAVYFAQRVEGSAASEVGAAEIWRRFPKFVLGFVGASVVFSAVHAQLGPDLGNALVDQGVIRSYSKLLRGWFFCLAFVSIGLATPFREFRAHLRGGKPLILYVCGQSLNLLLTLAMAYVAFRLAFPEIAAGI